MPKSHLVSDGIKFCGGCGRELPIDQFHKRSACKDGHAAQCKDCVRDYMRDYAFENRDPDAHARNQREYRKRNIHKEQAHSAVRAAIKVGVLVRPRICPKCNLEKFVEAHHEDYSKPLDVDWLCSTCHGIEHRQ